MVMAGFPNESNMFLTAETQMFTIIRSSGLSRELVLYARFVHG
jgi:hypothetical protein